jgi:antitoxin component of MazEF toxin-antitoxin module
MRNAQAKHAYCHERAANVTTIPASAVKEVDVGKSMHVKVDGDENIISMVVFARQQVLTVAANNAIMRGMSLAA